MLCAGDSAGRERAIGWSLTYGGGRRCSPGSGVTRARACSSWRECCRIPGSWAGRRTRSLPCPLVGNAGQALMAALRRNMMACPELRRLDPLLSRHRLTEAETGQVVLSALKVELTKVGVRGRSLVGTVAGGEGRVRVTSRVGGLGGLGNPAAVHPWVRRVTG